jgi:hypothetical protein
MQSRPRTGRFSVRNFDFEAVLLHKEHLAVAKTISVRELQISADPYALQNDAVGQLLIKLKGWVWSQETQNIFIATIPKSWFDHLLSSYVNSWWSALICRYRPIRFRTFDVSVKVLYPNINILVPREQHVLQYTVSERVNKR